MKESLNIEAHRGPVSLKSFRARESRRQLTALLGGKCARCGTVEALEFDLHPVRETSHHFMPWPEKVRFYWKQYLANNVQLLCRRCHVAKTVRENHKAMGKRVHGGINDVSTLAATPTACAVPSAILFCDGDGI